MDRWNNSGLFELEAERTSWLRLIMCTTLAKQRFMFGLVGLLSRVNELNKRVARFAKSITFPISNFLIIAEFLH